MLTTQEWSSQIYQKCQQLPGCVYVDYTTAKYIFFACILFGFLLVRCNYLLPKPRLTHAAGV